jgi:TATA-box binding protein (TBP) (component of TFIID and TFIIIB)
MDHLRISTMTAISSLNSEINLDHLFQNIVIHSDNPVISYIEHGSLGFKGESVKNKRKSRKPTKQKKSFFNQVTTHVHCEKVVNVKLFNNGKIQMTGLKYEGHGIKVLQLLIPYLVSMNEKSIDKIFSTPKIQYTPMNIVLINSDFYIGYPIIREKLHEEIIRLGYYSSYEPCNYPGVNIKYYYNVNSSDGICKCNAMCNGKGDGSCDGNCKKITIAVFQSGKALITGARNRQQLEIALKFISNFVDSKKDILQEKVIC